MRRWKLSNLPTYLPAARVRKALDGCDRKTVMGRRDYADNRQTLARPSLHTVRLT